MTLRENDFLWVLRYSSLLHDIGKFRQRCEAIKRIEQQKAGLNFIEKANLPPEVERFRDEIAKLVGSHHREKEPPVEPPKEGELKRLRDILIEADNLSATEREPIDAESELIISKVPLRSVFYEVKLGPETKAEERYYNVSPLREFKEEEILPLVSKDSMPETLTPQYLDSWVNFEREVNGIAKIKDIRSHFSTLYYLLMKYASFIPSAVYRSEPSISLFDHLSTTCAIAESIYRSEDGETLILIGGDIGSIQNFIYTVTSENASRMLRGRSFFVQLVNIVASRYILDKLKLPDPCLIFCGGGNFTILAPYTKELKGTLKESIRDINLWLLEEVNGEVYMAVGYIEVRKNELRDYGKLLQKLWNKIEEAKLKPFMEAPYEKVFEGTFEEAGRGKIRCKVCKKVFSKDELDVEGKPKYRVDDAEVCKLCKDLEKIGSSLPNTEYLVVISFKRELDEYELSQIAYEPYMFAKELKILVELHPDTDTLTARFKALCKSHLKGELKRIQVIRLNSADFQAEIFLKHLECELPLSFSFIPVANHVPRSDGGAILSFDDIVEKGGGAKYLAVLKMDVDNLGRILVEGFPEKKRTISRYATLSRLLSWFFEGYINQFIQDELKVTPEDDKEKVAGVKEKLYVVYSGGDDLFIVGRWDAVCEFAWRFERKFKRFVCGNPYITISAGLALVEPKYPVHRLWLLADKYVRQAKHGESAGKNKIAMFSKEEGYVVTWETLDKLRKLKNELVELIKNKEVARGFLFTLRKIHKTSKQAPSRAPILLKYSIGRIVGEKPSLKDKLNKAEKGICECMEFIEIPIIWAELETRRE